MISSYFSKAVTHEEMVEGGSHLKTQCLMSTNQFNIISNRQSSIVIAKPKPFKTVSLLDLYIRCTAVNFIIDDRSKRSNSAVLAAAIQMI